LIFAFLGLVSIIFLSQEEQFVLLILIVSALLRTFSVFILAIFQCSKKVNAYIYANIVFVFVLAIFVFTFVNLDASFYSWLYAMLIASSVQCIFVIKLYGFSSIKKYLPSSITFESLKVTFIPAALFMPQAIGWWLKSGADRFLINKYLGAEVLGNYALAFQLSSLQIIAVTTVNLAIVPLINEKLKSKDFHYVFKALFIMSFLCLFLSVFIYFLNIQVITLAYDSEYLLAIDMLLYLSFSNFFQAILLIYINVLYYENHGKYVALIIFLNFFVQFFVSYVVLSALNGSVQSIILVSLFFNLLVLYLVLRRLKTIFPLILFSNSPLNKSSISGDG